MTLPDDFQFSQGNLQDYADCRRRFQLRYLHKVAWPALESEPVLEHEQAMQQGALFHRMIQQHLLGIAVERLTPMAKGEDLSRWWRHYLDYLPAIPRGALYPEVVLSAPLQGYRLLAKYDLVLVLPEGRVVIYDWKTARNRPKRQALLERLQTRVYPYLLIAGGAHLNQGKPIPPESVEMVYWFSETPHEPERIPYSPVQHQQDRQYLGSLVAEIAALGETEFYLTAQKERCRFCTYRSLCERGVEAGSLEELEGSELALSEAGDFDFEQIAEIAF